LRFFKKRTLFIGVIFSLQTAAVFAQLNTTFERMFTQVLVDDIIYPPGFPRFFDEAAERVNNNLVPALNSFITSNVASFPLTSTVAGVNIDLSARTPELTIESLGPIYSETAVTIGKKKLYLALNYSYFDLSKLRGLSTEDIRFTVTQEDINGDGTLGDFPPENDTIDFFPDINIKAQTFVFYATYGLTSNFDVGFAIPLVRLNLSGEARAVINSLSFPLFGQPFHRFGEDVLNPQLVDIF